MTKVEESPSKEEAEDAATAQTEMDRTKRMMIVLVMTTTLMMAMRAMAMTKIMEVRMMNFLLQMSGQLVMPLQLG